MSEKVILTISILISNRPDTVRKCLDSIQPLLQAIPSELILTDTGCGEQVRSIIEEYTDHIIDFEWCRDFSKARNEGLKQAKGEWFLFLDDDEWFDDVSEMIRFFQSGEYKSYGFAAYTQRNYLDQTGEVYTELAVGRMTRIEKDTHFMYSIHECFNRVPGKVKKLHTFVHHYGYVYKTKEEAKAHSERNISLLLVEHEKHPENMKHTLQLAQEYNAVDRRQESLTLSLEAISYAECHEIDMDYCLPSVYGNAIDCMMELKQYEDVITKGEEYLQSEALDPLVEAMIYGILAVAYFTKEDYVSCLESVKKFLKFYQKQLEQDDIYLAYTTTITSDCFEQRNISVVVGAGVRAAILSGKHKEAFCLFQNIDMAMQKMFISHEMVRCIVKTLCEVEEQDREYYFSMCNGLLQRQELLPLVIGVIRKCVEERSEDKKIYAELSLRHWFFLLLKVQTEQAVTEEDYIEIWKQGKESLPDIVQSSLWEYAEKQGFSNQQIIENVPLYLWQEAVTVYCGMSSVEEREKLQQALQNYLPCDTWHYEVWAEAFCYSRLCDVSRRSSEKENDDKQLEEIWFAYAASVYRQARGLYQREVLEEMDFLLPAKIQAAGRVLRLQEIATQGEYVKAIALAKEIMELQPELAEVIRRYLHKLQEGMEEQEQAAKQFEELAVSVKAKIKSCLAMGDYNTAKMILEQLEAMIPGDQELAKLREKIGNSSA